MIEIQDNGNKHSLCYGYWKLALKLLSKAYLNAKHIIKFDLEKYKIHYQIRSARGFYFRNVCCQIRCEWLDVIGGWIELREHYHTGQLIILTPYQAV